MSSRTELLDARRFAITALLEPCWERIRDEMVVLSPEDFVPWPNDGAYSGHWLAFPLCLKGYAEDMPVDLERNWRRCPFTASLLDRFGRHGTYGFSRMLPQTHIYPHCDGQQRDVLRAHLGLDVPAGALFRIGTERVSWQDGKVLVFDGLIEHETANIGALPRTILLVDFSLTPDEMDYLEAVRGRAAAAAG